MKIVILKILKLVLMAVGAVNKVIGIVLNIVGAILKKFSAQGQYHRDHPGGSIKGLW